MHLFLCRFYSPENTLLWQFLSLSISPVALIFLASNIQGKYECGVGIPKAGLEYLDFHLPRIA